MNPIIRRVFLGMTGLGTAAAAIGNRTARLEAAKASSALPEKRKYFSSDRQDGRFIDTAGFLHQLMKSNPPKLAFNPNMKAEEFPAWQTSVREKLVDLMAFPDVNNQPSPKRLWIRKKEGYQIQKWEAYPEPYCVVPFMIIIPDGVNKHHPAPAVMCFPGSRWSLESLVGIPEVGKKSKNNVKNRTDWKWQDNRMALHFAKRGMIGVAVGNPATNDTDSDIRNRADVSLNAIWLGRSYVSISSFQKAKILEWISEQAFVDKSRIAVCGHSLGSQPTDILGVLYPDLIKAVIHNDFCCNWIERSVAQNGLVPPPHHIVPGMYQWYDATDLEAAIAPRPLLFTEGGRATQLLRIRAAFKLNGVEKNLKVFQYTKYIDPRSRIHDFKPLPEGLSGDEYFVYANVDVQEHCFRPKRAVPWLANLFGMKESSKP